MLTEKLNLADDQQAKLKPIIEDHSKQMKAIHDDTSLAPADKQAKMKEIHESSIEKMNAILTPDQSSRSLPTWISKRWRRKHAQRRAKDL
jgi:protein CpxP